MLAVSNGQICGDRAFSVIMPNIQFALRKLPLMFYVTVQP